MSDHCDGGQLLRIRPFADPGLALADSLGISGGVMVPLHYMQDTPLYAELHNTFQTMLRHMYRQHVGAQICKFNFHKNKYKSIATTYLQYIWRADIQIKLNPLLTYLELGITTWKTI